MYYTSTRDVICVIISLVHAHQTGNPIRVATYPNKPNDITHNIGAKNNSTPAETYQSPYLKIRSISDLCLYEYMHMYDAAKIPIS